MASFSTYRSSRCRHATGRSSPSSAARRRDAGVIGWNGCSPSSEPSITGVHSSSRPTRLRSSRVLPWPRSPSRTTSCPASSARSSCGITVVSKPWMPGQGSSPARELRQEVLAHFDAQRLLQVPGCAQLTDGTDGWERTSLGCCHGGHDPRVLFMIRFRPRYAPWPRESRVRVSRPPVLPRTIPTTR